MKRYIKSSEELVDTYIVSIWHEIDPGRDSIGPAAAQELFEVVANSPQQAIEYATKRWSGPIDRIEIVDVNPDPDDYQSLPY